MEAFVFSITMSSVRENGINMHTDPDKVVYCITNIRLELLSSASLHMSETIVTDINVSGLWSHSSFKLHCRRIARAVYLLYWSTQIQLSTASPRQMIGRLQFCFFRPSVHQTLMNVSSLWVPFVFSIALSPVRETKRGVHIELQITHILLELSISGSLCRYVRWKLIGGIGV